MSFPRAHYKQANNVSRERTKSMPRERAKFLHGGKEFIIWLRK